MVLKGLLQQLLPVCIIAGIASCTHEYVPDIEATYRIDVNLIFADPEFWPAGQQIHAGIFSDASSKDPVESVPVSQPENGIITISINNIKKGRYHLRLYITENGLYKVSLKDMGEILISENMSTDQNEITLITYDRVQNQIFNKCKLCHGGSSGNIAADLNLTNEYSFADLINIPAVKKPSMMRVTPGSATYSYLLKVLNNDIDFNHEASNSVSNADLQLITDWINEGAKNN